MISWFLVLYSTFFIGLASAKTLNIGYFNVAPHIFYDEHTKQLRGSLYDFFNDHIAKELGVNFKWNAKPMSIPRQFVALREGKLDICLVFAKNSEREQFLYFPENSFFSSRPSLTFLKGHPISKVDSIEDIMNLNIGYMSKGFISPFMRDGRVKFTKITNASAIRQNFKKLLSGRVHAVYNPESPPLIYHAMKMKVEDKVKYIYLPEKVPLFTVFSKKLDRELVDKYDKIFNKINGKKKYLELLAKYIDTSKL